MSIFRRGRRFLDGEPDLWPASKEFLPNKAAIDTPGKRGAEQRRKELIDKLFEYAAQGQTRFFVTPPEDVRIVEDSFHDIWGFGLQDDGSTSIQVPRHVVARRSELGQAIQFRRKVPAFLILGSMAHELAHRDRAVRDPERYKAIFDGFRADNRHEVDLSRVRHEEIATDVEAYAILQTEGIPLTPHDYIATIPQQPDYHQELADLL
ncbi:MAG TPA: hypothetical protein VLG11_00190 [Candidatus Saccharimonadales bacterium]|nr:hypothetical protein [Candidatus Saccharimonadales bacterium]